MAAELAKYGLQLPAFSKIGGILASELSVDQAAGRGRAPACEGRAPWAWGVPGLHMDSGCLSSVGRLPGLLGGEGERCQGSRGWPPDLVPSRLPVHAAVLAINEAVERGVVEDTLAALQNPSALLGNLREPLAAIYQELLAQAKAEKAASAQTHVRSSLGR